ncbi:MAG: hypothetical protein II567_11110 [Candidatus Riflebacteria bacterium]|nr:hypothetical protein [Candidatus Riflebacteria bacterium]
MNKHSFFHIFIIIAMLFSITNSVFAENLLDGSLLDSSPKAEQSQPANPTSIPTPAPVAEANTSSPANNAAVNNTTSSAVSDITAKYKFKTGDDKVEALVVKEHSDHETIEVNLDGQAFIMKARMNKPGSRKYKELVGTDEKTLIAEVKIKDNSFKLVDENDKLLWKVKIKEGKAKISDNEENKNPFVIKKSEDKVKVKDKNEKEIARVKYYSDNGKLKLKDMSGKELYISKEFNKLSGAIGVLAINDIPAKLRAVIACELIKQGF